MKMNLRKLVSHGEEEGWCLTTNSCATLMAVYKFWAEKTQLMMYHKVFIICNDRDQKFCS